MYIEMQKQLKRCYDAVIRFERTGNIKDKRKLAKAEKRLVSYTPPGQGNKFKKRKVNWLKAQVKYRPYKKRCR